ncbi:hypothetical protein PRIPAC_84436 [Pristionchus pacificus]|uniref:Uncharacterized protein n=1 Tax=Pristionchus pacificus TaxID=54126 RepID=A0A2A6BSB6_PRIPA|nr:hypothetical protein PRIPAC_84436 [Pristionchus pacificus]|eukprot:PDM68693.1 hypothetical protein PRIPAC_46995 [Pristionchus pacificus]
MSFLTIIFLFLFLAVVYGLYYIKEQTRIDQQNTTELWHEAKKDLKPHFEEGPAPFVPELDPVVRRGKEKLLEMKEERSRSRKKSSSHTSRPRTPLKEE